MSGVFLFFFKYYLGVLKMLGIFIYVCVLEDVGHGLVMCVYGKGCGYM